ncbi:hypothetical protein SAICODRAFT_205627 [Saitoella complicata NRRL Y-17804]|nr:uncharacterized protein SAICODRAFT_205627 [Saitoella complicata NRRL Y-17804]ODQ54761.1 hypothetical protein SAICODRAFT_205627 [Saitoella complicata NRRL Y-17804]
MNYFCPPGFLSSLEYEHQHFVADARDCVEDCCLVCPAAFVLFPKSTKHSLDAIPIVASVSLGLTLIILISWIELPRKLYRRNFYTTNFVVCAAVIFSIYAFVAGGKRDETFCTDVITRATGGTSARCMLQGMFFVFAVHGCLFWSLLRITTLHLKLAWQAEAFWERNVYFKYGIGWAIPIIFMCVATHDIEYTSGYLCTPAMGAFANGVLYIPMLVYSTIGFLVQAGTLIYVIKVLWEARIAPYLHTVDHLSENSEERHPNRRDAAATLLQAVRYVWQPLLYTTILFTGSTICGVLWIHKARDQPFGGDAVRGLYECSKANWALEECEIFADDLVAPKQLITIGFFLSVLGVPLFFMEARSEFWKAWAYFLFGRFPRQSPDRDPPCPRSDTEASGSTGSTGGSMAKPTGDTITAETNEIELELEPTPTRNRQNSAISWVERFRYPSISSRTSSSTGTRRPSHWNMVGTPRVDEEGQFLVLPDGSIAPLSLPSRPVSAATAVSVGDQPSFAGPYFGRKKVPDPYEIPVSP